MWGAFSRPLAWQCELVAELRSPGPRKHSVLHTTLVVGLTSLCREPAGLTGSQPLLRLSHRLPGQLHLMDASVGVESSSLWTQLVLGAMAQNPLALAVCNSSPIVKAPAPRTLLYPAQDSPSEREGESYEPLEL